MTVHVTHDIGSHVGVRLDQVEIAKSFGSPATLGLPGSGYAGLWWRGPRSFTGGTVLTPGGVADPTEIRGQTAPWLAFVGDHDGVDRKSTLVFVPAWSVHDVENWLKEYAW